MLRGGRLYFSVFVGVTAIASIVVVSWFLLIASSDSPGDAEELTRSSQQAPQKPVQTAQAKQDGAPKSQAARAPVSEAVVSSREFVSEEVPAQPREQVRTEPSQTQIKALTQRMMQKATRLFQSQSYQSITEGQLENIPQLDELKALQAEFVRLLNSHPDFTQEFLDLYAASPDVAVKKGLAGLISQSEQPTVTDAVLSRAFSSDTVDQGQWFDLLATVGIREPGSLEYVLTQLPTVSDSSHLVDALSAIRPDAVHNSDRHREITNEILTYVSYDDAQIRSSVFKATGYLIDEDSAHILEQGLADTSDIVREAATLSVQMNPVPSDAIRNLLLHNMNNPQETRAVRVAAYVALEQYPLNQSEREYHENFLESL